MTGDNIVSIGTDSIMDEGQSQADRILYEVMSNLYDAVLETKSFILEDGTNCNIKGFLVPVKQHDNPDIPQTEARYAFDVKLDKGPLDHLEFKVTCSGWGRNLNIEEPPK